MTQQANQQVITTAPDNAILQPFLPLIRLMGWEGIALVLIVGFFILGSGNKKAQLTSGRRVGQKEKYSAATVAQQQIRLRHRNKVTLYIGTPRNDFLAHFLSVLGVSRSIYIPNAQEGIAICGAPGKGKTFSTIDPLIRSSLDQGFPTIIYDFKGEQLRRHAAYAASLGYEVYVFAPGFPYSGTINPLDFLSDSGDSEMAKQLAVVINRNSQSGSHSKQNEYFSKAGDLLIQTLLMMAKGSIYPDLLMAWAILSLPDLAKRMLLAQKEGWLDVWAEVGATSLTSVASAAPTSGGIISTATNTFAPLISREFISCLCGKTTIPLELTGKRLLIFQLEQVSRDVVAPLLASILHLVVIKNLAQRRKEPLVLAMDEFPTLYLPDVVKWINEYRENGLVTILGFQFYPQLENRYGKELTRAILGACATKFVFNPQEQGTAEEYSKYFGEEEVVINTRSRTYGKNSSTSRSEQYHKRPLFSGRDILTMPKGKCIFVNPAYEGRDEAALPWCLKVRVPKLDIQAEKRSEALWDKKVRARLTARDNKLQLPKQQEELRQELRNRVDFADSMFPPLPGEAPEDFESDTTENN